MSTRQKRLEKAQMQVLFRVPFFAAAVAKLPVVWDSSLPTAATDGKEIRWNGEWFDKLPDEVLPTVLCHEACHCLLGHLWRAPAGVDWQQWNIATDHAVNLMLKEFGAGVKAQNLADPFPFPDPQDAYCADPQFANMAEEVIYAKLGQRPKQPQGSNPGSGQGQGGGASQPGQGSASGSGSGGSNGKGAPNKTPAKGNSAPNSKPGPGSMPDFGQMTQPKGGGQSSHNKLRNDWQATLIQAAAMCKGRGDLPSGMDQLIDGLVEPAVPWFELLRAFLREQAADDWDWLRPDPVFDETGFIMPSLRSEKMGGVIFAKDTSGSIGAVPQLLATFISEEQQCLDDLQPAFLRDYCCDSKIHSDKEYRPGDQVSKNAPGGGGTDFRPVFEAIEKLPAQPKCLVYLTDLDGTFPDETPNYPVLWVTWEKDGSAPFGEIVRAAKA